MYGSHFQAGVKEKICLQTVLEIVLSRTNTQQLMKILFHEVYLLLDGRLQGYLQ